MKSEVQQSWNMMLWNWNIKHCSKSWRNFDFDYINDSSPSKRTRKRLFEFSISLWMIFWMLWWQDDSHIFDYSTFMSNIYPAIRIMISMSYHDVIKIHKISLKMRMKWMIILMSNCIQIKHQIKASIEILLSWQGSIYMILNMKRMISFLNDISKFCNDLKI